jgi:3-phenylpropionate/trans-cinnamate dioxygenase ferredoxin reductase component
MDAYRYLIVGTGMTADAACRGVRDHDPDGSIAIVGREDVPPYQRPPLSKALWTGKAEDSIWCGTAELGVDVLLGRSVASLDLDARTVTDDQGATLGYERLLLATGGRPRRLPFGGDEVVYFRLLGDYRDLRTRAVEGARFVVIGGGFIGSELAAALTMVGCQVTIVFPEAGIGARLFPAGLAEFVSGYYRDKGVAVVAGETVTGIARDGDATEVTLGDGRVLRADGVVAGLGIEPVTELAADAGLAVADGIVVDGLGRAGRDDVFAAGDVARFPASALGIDLRVEHENHAVRHGRAVGANMAGANEPYDHLPFFYSDLFELGYEAVGEVDARRETIAHWLDENRQGIVCYLDDERRPRGFLLWDVWGKVDAATELIRDAQPIDETALAALAG